MPRIQLVYDLDNSGKPGTIGSGWKSGGGGSGGIGSGWSSSGGSSSKFSVGGSSKFSVGGDVKMRSRIDNGGDAGRRRSSLLIRQDPPPSDPRERRPLSILDTMPGGSTARSQAKKKSDAGAGDGLSRYDRLRSELRNQGELWCDPDFPAESRSVYPSQPHRRFDWKRPKDICEKPAFFADGVSRFDVRQGELGDCWLLAAVASLSMHEDLFYQVVPSDQGYGRNQYCGAFLFRFWQFGQWKDVIVDDRLPCSGNRLVFMHSTDKAEFWSALLEKAYAKLNGSYEALVGGSQAEAMEDFTGGLCETIDLTNPPERLEKMLMRATTRCSLMGCSIEPDDDEIEARLPNGLIAGHAYSVTDARYVHYQGTKTPLVRIRNPWGDSSEWKGRWSDSSREWRNISADEKSAMGLQFEDDGEFWMSLADFIANFTKLEICHLGPESLGQDELGGKKKRRWEECLETGQWQKNVNAGGCRNYLSTFWTNPQFRIEVIDPDEDDDEDSGTIIIGLMQKDVRKKLMEFMTIGYCIYKLKDPDCGPLDLKFFRFNTSVAKSPSYINQREICGRHQLPPGHYCVVPTTFQPGEEAEFILRIFCERACDSQELDTINSYDNVSSSISGGDILDGRPADPAPMMPYPRQIFKEMTSEEDRRQEENLKKAFMEFAGSAGYITAYHLRDILNVTIKKEMSKFEGFNVEVCRSMVAIYDVDQSGRMEFDEFRQIWKDLRLWKNIFKQHDFDGNGNFNAYELRMALQAIGFKISNKLLGVLANRYADPREGTISFEDFLLCTVRLVTSFELFKAQPKEGNCAMFEEDEFLRYFVYI